MRLRGGPTSPLAELRCDFGHGGALVAPGFLRLATGHDNQTPAEKCVAADFLPQLGCYSGCQSQPVPSPPPLISEREKAPPHF